MAQSYRPSIRNRWKTNEEGMKRLAKRGHVLSLRGTSLSYVRFLDDFPVIPINNIWTDVQVLELVRGQEFTWSKRSRTVIQRCILMATDPGDLVLDPTCGSGTTATVAEQWGRRWITIDTSRVALALARARIMGARYPFYLLADSREGQLKEAEVTRTAPSSQPVHGNIRHGFVYERVPHITLKSIANNAEIDVIWDKWQAKLEPLRETLNTALKKTGRNGKFRAKPMQVAGRSEETARRLVAGPHRPAEGDRCKSIAAKAEFEYLYDKPYEDKKKVRVAGPFTVESLSPHRVLGVDENDELIDPLQRRQRGIRREAVFPPDDPGKSQDRWRAAGAQGGQDHLHRADPLARRSGLRRRPLHGRRRRRKRAAIFIGPEFGTVQRADLVAAAREAGDAGFDVLIACAFNYEAHTTEFSKLGRIPVLKARMNADLHMADDLKNTGKGNLFVIFGEPDITLLPEKDGKLRVKVNGVDVFHPRPAKSAATAPKASPAGSSTPITTRKASSSATPTSSGPTILTAP